MAKLTDVPVVTSLDAADLIYGVDVSDPTDDPAGSSVAITKANLLAGAGGGGSTTLSTFTEIETITNTVAGEFNFTVPAGYDRLKLIGSSRSNKVATEEYIQVYFNGDYTDANYKTVFAGTLNGASWTGSLAWPLSGEVTASTAIANEIGTLELLIDNPDGDQLKNQLSRFGQSGSTNQKVGNSLVTSSITAPITQITIRPDDNANGLVGSYTLYGEKEMAVGGGGTVFTQETAPVTYAEGDVWFEGTPPGGDVDLDWASVHALAKFEDGDASTTVADEKDGTWTSYGSLSEVTTDQAKFGTGSWLGNGTNASLALTNPPTLGLAEFTIEFHAAPVQAHQTSGRVFQSANGDVYTGLSMTVSSTAENANVALYASSNGGSYDVINGTTVLTAPVSDQFYHIVLMRKAGVLYCLIDGVQVTSAAYAGTFVQGAQWIWGGQFSGPSRNAGYAFDEVRVTAGLARYDETGFTPPTVEYPNAGPAGYTNTHVADDVEGWIPITTGASTTTNLPVVQSAWFDVIAGGSVVGSSSESGWAITKTATGKFDITFPTSETEQQVAAGVAYASEFAVSVENYDVMIHDITATGCKVITSIASNGVHDDIDFTIIRRLPDAPAQALVATQPAGTMVTEELGRITDPGAGGYVFTGMPTNYDRWILKGELLTTAAVNQAVVEVIFNSDTTDANYFSQMNYLQDSSETTVEQSLPYLAWVGGTTAFGDTSLVIEVPNPSGSSNLKKCSSKSSIYRSSGAQIQTFRIETFHDSMTAPLTTFTVKAGLDPSSFLTGTLILYGERTI